MKTLTAWCLLILAATGCARDSEAGDSFPEFWAEFRDAVEQDQPDEVARLTRFPFLFQGEPRRRSEFRPVYDALFDQPLRECVAAAQPLHEPDGSRSLACGVTILVFSEDADGWRFSDFAADPEAVAEAGAADTLSPDSWRVEDGAAAPWSPTATPAADMRGAAVRFGTNAVTGPPPLGCDDADYEYVVTGAGGLFQGALADTSQAVLADAGITSTPVITLRVSCTTGVFDYHIVEADRALLALDNVIWRLRRQSAPVGPAAVVVDLLSRHMVGDMGFTPATVQSKRPLLTPELVGRVQAYFATPWPADEPPPINGDPWTSTQEYPDRFTLDAVSIDGDQADVVVVFADGRRARQVRYRMLRTAVGEWRVDDLIYEDGNTLRDLLAPDE